MLVISNFALTSITAFSFCQAQNSGLRNDGITPELFNSLPALNEAASYLSQAASLITGCFSDYSGRLYLLCFFLRGFSYFLCIQERW